VGALGLEPRIAVICGIAAVIVWQTRQETGDEAH